MKTYISIAVLTVVALTISSCGTSPSSGSYGNSSGSPSQATEAPVAVPTIAPPTVAPTPAPAGDEVKAQIAGFAFSPADLTVKVGTTVTWTNEDGAPHIVATDDGSFKSETLNKGDTFSFTFSQAGTFPYHCGIHASMKGTVTVTP